MPADTERPVVSASPVRQDRYGTQPEARANPARIFEGETPVVEKPVSDPTTRFDRVADASGEMIGPESRGYELNFESVDVDAVCKAVLGDILKANYSVDHRVTGQISLTSMRPIPKSSLLPLLETALASIGASIVKDADLYRIVPSNDTGGIADVGYQPPVEGFGTTVISAKYITSATMARMLDGLGSRAGSVKADPALNVVLVQGSAVERRAALDAASLVDVDWLRSKSVAILPTINAPPDTIIAEVNHILDTGEGGLSQGVVQLQPMSRLNAVLAVSRRRDAVDIVAKWVERLDRADYAVTGVKVYRLQYAQANTVASMLNAMFHLGSGPSPDKSLLAPSDNPSTLTQSNASGTTSASQALSTGTDGGNPFGVIKASLTDASKAAKPDDQSAGASTGRTSVTADVADNELFINANTRDYKAIERAIIAMDRQPVQVNIQATIAEVTLTQDLQYGVQAYFQSHGAGVSLGGANGSPLQQSFPGLNLLYGAVANPKVLLNALSAVTDVRILSSPSLVVLDHQSAVLQVGDQVPILTRQATTVDSTAGAVVNSVDYRDTGIILNVAPRVGANGMVSLDVEQQISAVSNTDATTLTPTISQRRVRSSVAVANGQTVMLAGLISENRSGSHNSVPGLSNIRFIGDILGSHDQSGTRTELVIFIKPQIIASSADAQQVTEEFRNRLTSMRRAAPLTQAGAP